MRVLPFNGRTKDEMRCLSLVEYKGGDAVFAIRCQKDGRHGLRNRRAAGNYHRADYLVTGGTRVKVTWEGKGILSPDMMAEWEAGIQEGDPGE